MLRISMLVAPLFAIFLIGAAAAQEANDCDYQAAHKSDPNRMAPGVAADDIIPRLAIAACESAVAANPAETRFEYQLGRAYAAAGRSPEAEKAFQQAFEAGYPMAAYNLGLIAQEAGNDHLAAEMFHKAVDAGIVPAVAALASVEFSNKGYSNPEFFQAVYDGSISGNPGAITYATSFLKLFYNQDGCQSLVPTNVAMAAGQLMQRSVMSQVFGALAGASRDGTFEGAAAGGFAAGQGLAANLAMQVDSVKDDAQLFYNRHSCNTQISRVFFSHLGQWILSF